MVMPCAHWRKEQSGRTHTPLQPCHWPITECDYRKSNADRACVSRRATHNSTIHAGNGTFFSDSPDEATPVDAIKGPRFEPEQNKQRSDGARGPISSTSKRPPPIEQPNADIAPWMDDGPELSTHGLTSLTNFNTDAPKLQPLSSIRPDTSESEPRDVVWDNEERRPSLASATTESSQTSVSNSVSKASTNRSTPYKKVAGFFSDDGRQSSRSSDTSIPATLQREQTSSSTHGSLHHGSRDEGRPPTSPTGSGPLTPLPSSDVTPWLFQDFKVSFRACNFAAQSLCACCYRRMSTQSFMKLLIGAQRMLSS